MAITTTTIDCGWTSSAAAEDRQCMYYRTFPAIEQLTASADRTCTDLVTREITVPDEIYGFTWWRFCEPHWHMILRWALRMDEKPTTKKGFN